eukprot:1220541-Rhodomonas_salina.1
MGGWEEEGEREGGGEEATITRSWPWRRGVAGEEGEEGGRREEQGKNGALVRRVEGEEGVLWCSVGLRQRGAGSERGVLRPERERTLLQLHAQPERCASRSSSG